MRWIVVLLVVLMCQVSPSFAARDYTLLFTEHCQSNGECLSFHQPDGVQIDEITEDVGQENLIVYLLTIPGSNISAKIYLPHFKGMQAIEAFVRDKSTELGLTACESSWNQAKNKFTMTGKNAEGTSLTLVGSKIDLLAKIVEYANPESVDALSSATYSLFFRPTWLTHAR